MISEDLSALMEMLITAAGAKTDEEKARVLWRASDYMWWNALRWSSPVQGEREGSAWPIWFCRAFNNRVQDMDLPWVEGLWTKEEMEKRREHFVQIEAGDPSRDRP